MARDKRLAIRMTEENLGRLKKLAADDGQTMTDWVKQAIRDRSQQTSKP